MTPDRLEAVDELLTFREEVLAGHDSMKGFRVRATDGRAGRVSWGSYAPGEGYLVVTIGLFSRKHHVVPASAVTNVGDGDVRVGFTRAQIKQLPDLPHPEAPVANEHLSFVPLYYAPGVGLIFEFNRIAEHYKL